MQNNIMQTGSNWTGRFPRTTQEAFPQFPGSLYQEPTVAQKIADLIVTAAWLAALGIFAFFGAAVFGG